MITRAAHSKKTTLKVVTLSPNGIRRELVFTRGTTSLANSQDYTPPQIPPGIPSQEDSNLFIQEIDETANEVCVENEDVFDRPIETPPPILSPIIRTPVKVAIGSSETETQDKQKPSTSRKVCGTVCKGKYPVNKKMPVTK